LSALKDSPLKEISRLRKNTIKRLCKYEAMGICTPLTKIMQKNSIMNLARGPEPPPGSRFELGGQSKYLKKVAYWAFELDLDMLTLV
jgi:hypothetical protein